jgi:hypothetical protein
MFADEHNPVRLDERTDFCVYQLIIAKCTSEAMRHLRPAHTRSGYNAYKLLQRRCAQITEDVKTSASQNFTNLTWPDNESATKFLMRFLDTLGKCYDLGLRYTDIELVQKFFACATRLTIKSPYYVEIVNLRHRRGPNGDQLTMTMIEEELYALDEHFYILTNPSSQRKQYLHETALSTRHDQRRPHQRRPNTTPSRKPYNPDLTCTYCKQTGHRIEDCYQKRRDANNPTPIMNNRTRTHTQCKPYQSQPPWFPT